MGNVVPENLTPTELRYKTISQNTYVDGIPVGCYAVSDKTTLNKLLDIGYDFNVMDKNKKTPYHYAIDFEDTFKRLLSTNASFTKDIHGNTPLHYAVTKNKVNLVKHMTSCMFEQNNEGDTPLHLAVKHNKVNLFIHTFEYTPQLNLYQHYKTALTGSQCTEKQHILHDVLNNDNLSVLALIIKHKQKDLLKHVAEYTSIEMAQPILAKEGVNNYDSTVELMQCLISK